MHMLTFFEGSKVTLSTSASQCKKVKLLQVTKRTF